MSYISCYFFFFQAEDGIRDYKVTGVQTCALPILEQMTHRPADSLVADWHRALTEAAQPVAAATGVTLPTDRAQRLQARLMPVTTTGARALVSPGKEQRVNIPPALRPDGPPMAGTSD